MITTIKLHGFLGKKYGRSVSLDVENMFQVMSGLVSRFGHGFKEDIRKNNWHVIEGKKTGGDDFGEEDINRPLRKDVLHLVPAVVGANSAVRVIVGIVLIYAGYVTGNQYLIMAGVSMVLGGVVEMLTKPKIGGPNQPNEDKGSYVYNAAVNVTSQGGPIPLIYGRVKKASSVVISTDFSSDSIIQPDNTYEYDPWDNR